MIPGVMGRDERIARFAAEYRDNQPRAVHVEECDTCGYLRWVSCKPCDVQPPPTVVTSMPDGHCERCGFVAVRAPELYQWVLSVIVKHEQGGGHTA